MFRAAAGALLCAWLAPPPGAWAAARVERRSAEGCEVVFSFSPQVGASSVSVAGSFNDWNPAANPLTDPEGGGLFAARLLLPAGRHSYKFVVDGKAWVPDPDNPDQEPDGFDAVNSVLVLGGAGGSAKSGDGRIEAEFVRHGPGIEFREWLKGDNRALLRLKAAAGDVEAARLRLGGGFSLPMAVAYSKDGFDYWEALFKPFSRSFDYVFELKDGTRTAYLGGNGLSDKAPAPAGRFSFDPASAPSIEVPAWVADAVFYQVFPERFANGDPANDPPGSVPWESSPTFENRFGGDLEGVLQKLPYLQELGVNALYLNPVFASSSSHKYDTSDYLRVDPALGGDGALDRLLAEARSRGMRVVLDGVFNHSGDSFWAFQDVLKNQERSAYKSWYFIRSFPVSVAAPTYDRWWGFAHLPKLNTGNPETREHLLNVGERWVARGASGWRLDVPNEVPHAFWAEFRKRVRKADPQAYIVGELWSDGLPWLGGGEFDAVMNYQFRAAVLDFLGPKASKPGEFHDRLMEQRHRYPKASLPAQFNLLGSHDTARLRTVLAENDGAHRLAVLLQMTYLGAPVVYYGDEAGMAGGKDPACRAGFPWEPGKRDLGLTEHYRKLIAIRRSNEELRRGAFKAVLVDDAAGVYAFTRKLMGRAALVVLHRGEGRAKVELDAGSAAPGARTLVDLYSGSSHQVERGRLSLDLGPWQGLVLKRPGQGRGGRKGR